MTGNKPALVKDSSIFAKQTGVTATIFVETALGRNYNKIILK